MNRIYWFLLLFLPLIMNAQQELAAPQADIVSRWKGDTILLAPVVPALQQIPGAPTAYYDYYWEFGDGSFSFREKPSHVYQDTARKDIYLLATGKYDNGKAPRSRKKKTEIPKDKPSALASVDPMPAVLKTPTETIGMRAVRNPRAGEELTCILAYANHTPAIQSGDIHLFFNQKEYKADHFSFMEARTHFGEKENSEKLSHLTPTLPVISWSGAGDDFDWYSVLLPATDPKTAINALNDRYKQSKSWHFEGLQPEELRHLFFSLQATDQMVADTHAIITVSALLVSDDQRLVEQYDLEMEIVASHDPNYIAVSKRRMGYRRIKSKDLEYKVHFQNNGEGPASTIQITCDAPPGLDAAHVQVVDMYPQCPLCAGYNGEESCLDTTFQEGKLIFTFRNIYLPGTRQEGVDDRDSTKGFVKYRLLPDKKMRKLDFASNASIVFDKNPPIRTNRAGTDFKPGLSPGVMAGYNAFPSNRDLNYYFAGLSAAPFKPYRRFLQWEAMIGFPQGMEAQTMMHSDSTSGLEITSDSQGIVQYIITDTFNTHTQIQQTKPLLLHLVPLQLRKNWTDFFSTGIGAMVTLEFNNQTTTNTNTTSLKIYRSPEPFLQIPREFCMPLPAPAPETTRTETNQKGINARISLFADVHLGLVRQGPALGLRPVLRLGEEPSFYLSAFAYWKF